MSHDSVDISTFRWIFQKSVGYVIPTNYNKKIVFFWFSGFRRIPVITGISRYSYLHIYFFFFFCWIINRWLECKDSLKCVCWQSNVIADQALFFEIHRRITDYCNFSQFLIHSYVCLILPTNLWSFDHVFTVANVHLVVSQWSPTVTSSNLVS